MPAKSRLGQIFGILPLVIEDPYNLLATIDWHTRSMVKTLARNYHKLTGNGLQIRSGRRSCEEQDAIYAQGRTTPGTISTSARGCKSWHVIGRAVDADPFDPRTGKVFPGNSDEYRRLGDIWKKLGGIWGGDFPNLYDPGHFEWHPDKVIEDICPENMACVQLKVQNKVPIYLLASGAILLLTVGIFTATVTMKVPARA